MSSPEDAPTSGRESMPRENLIRALLPGPELRSEDGEAPVMRGHFSVFNEWTEINSAWEGRFMERIAPGAFKKTFTENRDRVKVTFNHGHDELGDLILGRASVLEEDERGAYYEVPLYRGIPELLLDGLKDGAYGSSFRFKVMKEDVDKNPDASDVNPGRLPERTITEVRLMEFGPVTFPAYEGATAGVRSLTDRFRPQLDDEVLSLLRRAAAANQTTHGAAALETGEPAKEATPSRSSRSTQTSRDYTKNGKEVPTWLL